MAKVVNPGYTDTSIPENPTLTRGKLNFTTDYRVSSEKAGEVRLINMTSPNDRVERIVISSSEVADVYKNTGIQENYMAPSKKGVNVFISLQDVYAVTDDVDASFNQHIPVYVSLSVKTLNSQYVTAAEVQTAVARAVSCLYDQGATTTTRLTALLKGSTKPKEI